MTPQPKLNPQVREQAVDWLIAFCEEDVDARGREEFNTWLRSSPEHVRAYLRVSAFWEVAGELQKGCKRDVDALVQRAMTETNVVALGSDRRQASSPAWTSRRFAIAASVLVVTGASLMAWFSLQRDALYSTAIGEHRTVTLSDGSTVEMNALSRIEVRYDKSGRRIDLLEGQALFKVATDAARPFVVRSGEVDIRALGTRFDVNRKRSGIMVTVLEGSVAVSSVVLKPGDQVTVSPQSHQVVAAVRPNLQAATAWTDGLLVFDGATLADVAQEYNRHNLKPLEVEDPALRELKISGIFPATGSARITGFLRERFGVAVEETQAAIRISR